MVSVTMQTLIFFGFRFVFTEQQTFVGILFHLYCLYMFFLLPTPYDITEMLI